MKSKSRWIMKMSVLILIMILMFSSSITAIGIRTKDSTQYFETALNDAGLTYTLNKINTQSGAKLITLFIESERDDLDANADVVQNLLENAPKPDVDHVIGLFMDETGHVLQTIEVSYLDETTVVTEFAAKTENNSTQNVPTVSEDDSYQLGEPAVIDDIQVTLLSVQETSGSSYFKPDNGCVFLFIEFDITNNSNEEINISSILSFDTYVDDRAASYDFSANIALSMDGHDMLDGLLPSGKSMIGMIGIQVDEDWQDLEVHFKPSLFNSNHLVFKYKNKTDLT